MKLDRSTVVQNWTTDPSNTDLSPTAVKQGAKVIMSPADHAYLDMKYDASSPLGLQWAGFTNVQDSYAWDPARQASGVGAKDVLGVEAPLWGETVQSIRDAEYL